MWTHRLTLLAVTLAAVGCESGAGIDATQQNKLSSNDIQNTDATCDPEASPFGGGTGTQDDPYLICSIDHMQSIDDLTTGHAYYYQFYARLESDLDYSDEVDFKPLENCVLELDGNGHTIRNVTYNYVNGDPGSVGFFSDVCGVLKDITFENISMSGQNLQHIGLVASQVEWDATLDNVVVTSGNLDSSTDDFLVTNKYSGSIAGHNMGTIKNSFAHFTYTADSVGGIAGVNDGTIDSSDSDITISGGGNNSGRVVYYNRIGSILSNCAYNGASPNSGTPYFMNSGTVTNCQ